jgi:hypothetical protein
LPERGQKSKDDPIFQFFFVYEQEESSTFLTQPLTLSRN